VFSSVCSSLEHADRKLASVLRMVLSSHVDVEPQSVSRAVVSEDEVPSPPGPYAATAETKGAKQDDKLGSPSRFSKKLEQPELMSVGINGLVEAAPEAEDV
jgi:hypothetical protein